MAHRTDKNGEDNRGKNLILVSNISNNSQYFPEHLGTLFSRSSSVGKEFDDVRRRSSISNLFPGFKNDQPYREEQRGENRGQTLHERYQRKEEPVNDEQRYAMECLQYEKYMFDDKIRLIIHRMAIKGYQNFLEKKDHPFLSFFVERYLCTLSKKLLLNRFQLLFLEYVFEESKWRYDLDVITNCNQQFKHYIHVPESQGNLGVVKNLQIYLLFCAYYSKKSLNELNTENMFNHFLNNTCPRFKEKFNEWSLTSGIVNIKINPKILNNIFKRLTSNTEKEKDYIENYNVLVEQILDISPAYNADKEGKSKKKKKKEQHQNVVKQQELLNKQIGAEESPDFPSLNFRKKQTSYVSNVDGLDPIAYYNRQNI